ncbi:hypothetical protein SCA03_18470 [Streptomyces cacaoi]|uniref:Uncharacterized protein n=1 Tax=Streptomyces cacaoi TaxID=1898 RepID=A0A4Y3QV49_STRCI|nr:hypothetical protein SCA03_18470 [Streptomyces cacaoi]
MDLVDERRHPDAAGRAGLDRGHLVEAEAGAESDQPVQLLNPLGRGAVPFECPLQNRARRQRPACDQAADVRELLRARCIANSVASAPRQRLNSAIRAPRRRGGAPRRRFGTSGL